MAEIKVTGLTRVQKKFRRLEKKFPTLRRNTLNDMARDAQKNAKNIVKSKFVNRNKFTVGSIRTRRATRSASSFSAVGSLQKYLADQEFGKGSLKVGHIPTTKARTNSKKDKPVGRSNKIHNLGTSKARATGKKNVRILIMAARRSNTKGPFRMTFQGKKGKVDGLFKLTSKKKTIVMIQDLRKSHVTIPKKPWLAPATKITLRRGQKIFKKNLKFFV